MSYRGHTVAVVVPARNEAAFVGDVVRTIPDFVDQIIVVDDASTDGTAAAAHRAAHARLEVISLAANAGVGGATIAGYRRALDAGAEIVAKIDGDGQMPPEHLPALIDALVCDGYAYAKGNRLLGGSTRAAMPPSRFVGNMILTFLNKLASGYWHIFDPQNGYTAVTADALRRLDLDSVHQGYFFENDMLVHLNLYGLRVKDIAMPPRYGREISGLSPIRVGITFPWLLLRRFAYRVYQKYVLRDFSPIALFLLLGATMFFWGIGFGVYLWVKGRVLMTPTPTGTIMLAIVPLFLGFQLLLQAIVLDIQETPR